MENFETEVVKSARRTKSASWALKGQKLIVTVPAKWTKAQIEQIAAVCAERARKSLEETGAIKSDAALAAKSAKIRAEILQEIPDGPIKWSEKPLRSRWGHCSGSGVITISRQLMNAPEEVLDAVIVHELAHRVESGHGKEFVKIVERYKKYKESAAFLKGAAWAGGWAEENC